MVARRRKNSEPATGPVFVASPPPLVNAAAGAANQIGALYSYSVGVGVERALSVPTISRARDLIVSMVGSLELRHYGTQWTGEMEETIPLPPETWMRQPDPSVTRNWVMAQTTSDLFFYGRAFWYVLTRYANGFPASFTWLPAGSVTTEDQAGPQWFGVSDKVSFLGKRLETRDVIQFLSPIQGVLFTGSRVIDIAIRLDTAARRFASNEIAAGYLQQTGGEPMSGDELAELAAAWSEARATNAIGALNEFVRFEEFNSDPNKLQLMEGREHAALELSRVANIPPYLVGIPTGGMTYQNAQQARQDLYLFGARPFITCIEETLSMNNVLPRNRHVRFDIDMWLEAHNLQMDPVGQEVPAQ